MPPKIRTNWRLEEVNKMTDYYLNIETTGTDIENDEILTIQYQQLDTKSGRTESDLIILKSWGDSSEKEILEDFLKIFDPRKDNFSFIPIGKSLHFVFLMLHNRWKKYGINVPLKSLIYDTPNVDIKSILTILNGGMHKGASLNVITGKKNNGVSIHKLYANKDYKGIEDHIVENAENFIKFYQLMKVKLPLLKPLKEHQP